MQIKRRGSERDHGSASTELVIRSTAWDIKSKSIEVTAWFVPDFSTAARHDWYISITLEELASMLNAAASAVGSIDTEQVGASLMPSLTAVLRLATECTTHLTSLKEIIKGEIE